MNWEYHSHVRHIALSLAFVNIMTKAKSTKHVIKEIGCDKLSLICGNGYLYFVYDDVENGDWFDKSIAVCRLSHLDLERWIEEGKEFLKEIGKA